MQALDFTGVDVVDNHCHPFRLADVLARPADDFEARCTFLGMCAMSSQLDRESLWPYIRSQSQETMFALILRRWLAGLLGCDVTAESVARARQQAINADPTAYVSRLMTDQNIVALVADDGYPQPPITRSEFAAASGVTVYRVARVEPMIDRWLRETSFRSLVNGVVDELHSAAKDPDCVAFKSIIAYRTGLDVLRPSYAEADAAYTRWGKAQWQESRDHSKLVRDFLLGLALDIAGESGKPFHFHCGGGDSDINLRHARPQDLFPLLVTRVSQPIVLIHCGYPWISEAAYIASVLPNTYLDLSVLVPWSTLALDAALELVTGTVPMTKILYSSDESTEPEVLWAAARLMKGVLSRVLGRAVTFGYVTHDEARRLGSGILGANTRRLHGK